MLPVYTEALPSFGPRAYIDPSLVLKSGAYTHSNLLLHHIIRHFCQHITLILLIELYLTTDAKGAQHQRRVAIMGRIN